MLQKGLLFGVAALLLAQSETAVAQLNKNPWLQANDQQAIAKVYDKKERRLRKNAIQNYQPQDTVVVDRTHAYIQDTEEENADESLTDKVKNSLFSTPKEETPLIPNTKQNRKKLVEQKQAEAAQEQTKETSSVSSLFDFSSQTAKLKKNFNLPLNKAKNTFNRWKQTTSSSLRTLQKKFK